MIKDYLLGWNFLTKQLGFNFLFKEVSSSLKLKILDHLSFSNVLILSPHPDDEILGCGGTLAKISSESNKITVLYLLTGAQEDQMEKIKLRKSEAREGMRVFGIDNLIFWNYPDGGLPINYSSIEDLALIILDNKTEVIFTPSMVDRQSDHLQVNRLLVKTLRDRRLLRHPIEIWAYEVWTPLFFNRLVNVSETMEQKRIALEKHLSQLGDREYWEAIEGLNRYRGAIMDAGKFAEAFFSCSADLYSRLFKRIYG